jgi:CIC family chloride channel protein
MTSITPSESAKKANVSGYYLLPAALRNFVRSRETGLVSVAIVIGLLSGRRLK